MSSSPGILSSSISILCSSISILSSSNLARTLANNLSILSLIFARWTTADGIDSEESLPFSVSVVSGLYTTIWSFSVCKNFFHVYIVFFHIFIITFKFWYICQQPGYLFIDICSLNYSWCQWWYRFWRITAIFCICCFWSFLCVRISSISILSSSISILSNSNLGTVANNLATLSLIFSRRVDDAGSEDLLILSASVDFRLITDRYFPFLF